MNAGIDRDARLDRAVRACHAEAVAQVSPRTLARLRPRAEASAARQPRPRLGWALATACAAVFAFAIGTQVLAPPDEGSAPMPMATMDAITVEPRIELYEDALVAFEEDPELFLWLASTEAQRLAME